MVPVGRVASGQVEANLTSVRHRQCCRQCRFWCERHSVLPVIFAELILAGGGSGSGLCFSRAIPFGSWPVCHCPQLFKIDQNHTTILIHSILVQKIGNIFICIFRLTSYVYFDFASLLHPYCHVTVVHIAIKINVSNLKIGLP